jgi:glycosyltransferase involved in cell wall biosynthesis
MLINLAKGLEKLNCTNVIGVFNNSSSPHLEIADRARKDSLSVTLVPCKGRLDFATIRFLRQYVRNEGISLIHAHGYKANLYAWLAARHLRVPLVATCHNWTHATISLRIYAQLDICVLRRFHKIVCVSMSLVDKLAAAGVPRKRILMVPNGVELPSREEKTATILQTQSEAKDVVVGTVGRMVPQKGFQFLLQVIPALLGEFPRTKFLFVGEGPFREALEQQSRELGIQSHVTFTGQQEDMRRVYESMDIFVLPSLNEGMPMTILEAMASAKPVIATSVGAIPTLIVPEVTGMLIQPQDSAGLRSALVRLLGEPGLRTSLGMKGRLRVSEDYSLQAMAQKYFVQYENLVQDRNVVL